ncbi:MarR family winged helix-turn-helix transcriptional regulator [Vibrio aphrogenes]|uniref:MarR family winged helix-turn-helix transcriptional regulator n=1 Tax=Vibrio aphrogenes TaxID=1891186 RepID=UPI000B34F957|nr:MarR family transcriptional regulator [Vibrio aphrogenes]
MSKSSVGYLLSDVSRLVRKTFQNDPKIGTITLAQAKMLSTIARHEGIKQVELAELLEIKAMTVARLIDQLVAEGLVERRASTADRRAYLIYLLPAAQTRLTTVKSVGNKVWQKGLSGLTEEQREQFIQTLEHIHRNFLQD